MTLQITGERTPLPTHDSRVIAAGEVVDGILIDDYQYLSQPQAIFLSRLLERRRKPLPEGVAEADLRAFFRGIFMADVIITPPRFTVDRDVWALHHQLQGITDQELMRQHFKTFGARIGRSTLHGFQRRTVQKLHGAPEYRGDSLLTMIKRAMAGDPEPVDFFLPLNPSRHRAQK